MKHFRYAEIDDYIEKAEAYTDAKTVKLFTITPPAHTENWIIYAIIHLHSAAIEFRFSCAALEVVDEISSRLESSGHKRGEVIERSPIKF